MIIKTQSKKRKNREESEIKKYKKPKKKATRVIEICDDSQKIEIIIKNCLDLVYKIRRKFKKEIFSLKRRIEKAEGVIEKIYINKNIVFESYNTFSAGVSMMQRTFKT